MKFTIIFIMLVMMMPIRAETKNVNDSPAKYGGTLVWGTRNRPDVINPILITTSVSSSLSQLIFNGLVRLNSKDQIVPDLAQSWDMSEDGLVYTFYLRENIRFHDGKEFTAADVKFTYDKIIDPSIDSPFGFHFTDVKEFKMIDKAVFQIVLKKPNSFFIYRLTKEIIPRHYFAADQDFKNSNFGFYPVGTGPFKFKEWDEKDQIILEYNPDYYEGRPYLDEIIVKIYASSRDVWNALMRGEIDYATFIEREDYEFAKNDNSFKTFSLPIDAYYALFFNMDDFILSDRKMREAIAYSIDRKELIDRASFGYGLGCRGSFYPDALGFNPVVESYEYNPKKAITLLNEAGWKDNNGDGILEKDGNCLEIKVLVDSKRKIYKKIIMIIRQQLQAVGIKVKVQRYAEDKELTKAYLEQNRPNAHLKLILANSKGAEFWSSDNNRDVKLWVYNNPEVDNLLAEGINTLDDDKKDQIYQRIYKMIYEDQPACFLYFPYVFHAVSSRFENVDEFFTLYMPTYTVKDWFVGE
jgi:peptide/nickel transport system substrate-binding protein